MKIRPTKLSDYSDISKLLWETKLSRSLSRNQFQKMLTRNRGWYLVAEEKNRVIASIFATHDGAYFGYIYKLVVDPRHRNKGIAIELINAVLRKFKRYKIYWIFILIKKGNKASFNLFKKTGFKIRKNIFIMEK